MIEPKPKLAHLRVDGLGGEEVMPQIHVLRVVPVVGGHVGDRVALVIGGVIDQYRNRTELRARLRDRRLERRDVGDVAVEKERRLARSPSAPPPAPRPHRRWRSTNATRA